MSSKFVNPLKSKFSESFFATIPHTPGVYFMRSQSNAILYIGKAKSLHARLTSYRHVHADNSAENILEAIRRVRKIEWEVHPDEAAAFARERELIRAIVPPYNIADAWEEDYLFIGLPAGAT